MFKTGKSDGPRAGFTVDGKPVSWDQLFDETKDDPEAQAALEKLRNAAAKLDTGLAKATGQSTETKETAEEEPIELDSKSKKPSSGWELKLE